MMLKITITVKEVEYCTFIMAKENLKNKKWIRVDIQEFYNFTMWVTQSPRIVKEETIKAIEKFFKKYIINLESN